MRTIIPYVAIIVTVIYYLLVYFDYLILPIQEILWNCLVYLMPSSLIVALDQRFSNSDTMPYAQSNTATKSQDHAAKSAVMRRVLGLEKGRFFAGFGGARRLSINGVGFKQERAEIPPGLGNWDNSCYQNSAIPSFFFANEILRLTK